MTGRAETAPAARETAAGSWALWQRQMRAILRMELFRRFFGFRSLILYFLASLPVVLSVIALVQTILFADESTSDPAGLGDSALFYAGLFELFTLRFVIFFGCVSVFTDLFRGDVSERSLHYYFLSPVRREILAAGKFLAGLLGTAMVLSITTALSYLLWFARHGAAVAQGYLFDGPGLGHLLGYLGVTVLACVGYGAVFLGVGLLFRNPAIPAVVFFGWEWINFLLPSLLKKLSVIHYLRSLLPVEVSEGAFALIAEPTSAWISVPGFVLFSAVVLALCAWRIRRMEIRYESDS